MSLCNGLQLLKWAVTSSPGQVWANHEAEIMLNFYSFHLSTATKQLMGIEPRVSSMVGKYNTSQAKSQASTVCFQ